MEQQHGQALLYSALAVSDSMDSYFDSAATAMQDYLIYVMLTMVML